ncbi:ZP4 protein, partial [Polypterus senegalus]
MIDHSSPTVEKFSNKRDSLISPVLPSDEVVTILGFESDDKDGSGDLLYQDFDVLDVDEINVPMKQNELNISMASPDMMVVKAINYNKKALVELSDFVVNTDVPHGADLEDSELLQDREDHDSEHSGAWSPALVALVKGIPSEQVCHEVAVFPYESSCSWMSMSAQFFGSPADLKVRLNSSLVQVIRIAHQCKYKMEKRTGFFIFTAYNDGCNVQKIRGCHVLTLLWQNEKVSLACPAGDVSVGLPPAVLCNDTSMTVGLPSVSPDDLKVKDKKHQEVAVQPLAERCHYLLRRRGHDLMFTASYKSCHVHMEDNHYILVVVYKPRNLQPVVVPMKCPRSHWGTTAATVTTSPRMPSPLCKDSSMSVLLPPGSLDRVKVLDDFHHEVLVHTAPKTCGYHLLKKPNGILFETPYQACHVKIVNHYYTLTVVYKPTVGPQVVITMKCLVRWHPPLPLSTPMKPSTPKPVHIVCGASSMSLELPGGLLGQVKVLDKSHHPVVVLNAPKKCQYHLVKRGKTIVFTAGYTSCHVYTEHSRYVVVVLYTSENGVQEQVTMKCPIHAVPTSSPATSSPPLLYSTTCKVSSMTLTLPGGSFNQVNIMDKSNRMVAVVELPRHCGYSLLKAGGHLLFTVEYKACDVRMQDHHYTLTVIYLSAAGDRIVQMKCPVQQASTALPTTAVHPHYSCMASGMTVVLPYGSLDQVKIVGNLGQEIVASKAPKHCGYKLVKGKGTITFSASYTACDIQVENHHYILHMSYKPAIGNPMTVTLSCPLGGDPFKTTTPATSTRKPSFPIECKTSSMAVALPAVSPNDVQVVGLHGDEKVLSFEPKECGYTVVKSMGKITLTALYTSCGVHKEENFFVLNLRFYPIVGHPVAVQMKCPAIHVHPTPPRTSPTVSADPRVVCQPTSMTVELPKGKLEDIKLIDKMGRMVAVQQVPKKCGYHLAEAKKISFLIPYKACDVKIMDHHYTLAVAYTPTSGGQRKVIVKCPVIGKPPSPLEAGVSCDEDCMSIDLPTGPLDQVKVVGCDLPRKKQVQCGPSGIYPNVCRSKGCCVDPKTSHCFYPMDTCTSDGHFVFAVYRTSSKPDVDPGSLYVSDHSCAPVICTPDFAVFKIPLTGCGTHRFVIGETSIYLADVFGKSSQIECRYSKGTHASAGYMVVNSPALPDVVSSGELGIVLRIAKDDGYATFFPDTQVPLRYLLGSKIYLEVKIVNPPTPEVVLLVHYCIAYPRSSENVWVLMYNGCPNALDYGTGLHLKDHNWQPVPKHTRRFDVTTFQFMDAKENLLDEEEMWIFKPCAVVVQRRGGVDQALASYLIHKPLEKLQENPWLFFLSDNEALVLYRRNADTALGHTDFM